MKKENKALRISAIVLALVLITTCLVSGTLAKYVTSADNSASARVAVFGVTITPSSTATFGDKYLAVAGGNIVSADGAATVTTVVASDGDNVVAPGTKGTAAGFTVAGTPEVDVALAYDCTVTYSDGWSDGTNPYYPIKYTLYKNGTAVSGATAVDAATIHTKVAALSTTVDAGTDLSTVDAYTIGWEWAFSPDAATDVKDTALGNAAAAGDITVSIAFTMSATQVD